MVALGLTLRIEFIRRCAMRMRSIEVDEEVYRALQQLARPFEDTPNTVLRRLLGLDKPEPTVRVPKGEILPRSEYRLPILEALSEMGGSGRVKDVLERVYEKVKLLLTRMDLEEIPSGGDIRWRKQAQWERYLMVQDGLLRDDSPRGVWEITDKGWEYLHRTWLTPKKD
jgi:hypothetical protein